jgi:hypothetical protein
MSNNVEVLIDELLININELDKLINYLEKKFKLKKIKRKKRVKLLEDLLNIKTDKLNIGFMISKKFKEII